MKTQPVRFFTILLMLGASLSSTALASPELHAARAKAKNSRIKVQSVRYISRPVGKACDAIPQSDPVPTLHRVSTGQGTITFWR